MSLMGKVCSLFTVCISVLGKPQKKFSYGQSTKTGRGKGVHLKKELKKKKNTNEKSYSDH